MPTVKKEAPAKKPTKKTSKKAPKVEKPKSEGQYGIERSHDLPWSEKKVALFKALKSLKATSQTKAVTASQVAEASGGVLATKDVRHYSYHAKAADLVEVVNVEGVAGYCFHLTQKGSALNPDKALAQQEKEKAANKKKEKAAE